MKNVSRRGFLGGALAGVACLAAANHAANDPKRNYNVLFVVADDLRPELNCYGNTSIKSPNVDRLARRGLLFERAYCQQAVCNPSRASLLTGRRPDTTRVYDLQTNLRQTLPNVVTLPQFFKQHGYHAQAFGKIFHDDMDDAPSWSAPTWPARNAGMQYVDVEALARMKREHDGKLAGVDIPTLTWTKHESWQAPDVPDGALQDGQTATHAIAALRELKNQRFFLAVGFQKPHLPFVAPRKYFDLYPPESINLPPDMPPPQDAPQVALHRWTELRGYTDIPKQGPLSAGKARELVRGYYAGISYMDAQLGRVLDELDRLNLTNNTVIVFWGDHGFHLGEHSLWAKTSNYELDARAPFILVAPKHNAEGKRTSALVEFVDIYPSLCELCDLPAPAGLEGTSVAPLLSNPNRRWKQAAFTQFPHPNPANSNQQVMGRTVRTDRYRYTEWAVKGEAPMALELYDHVRDPNETVNIAARPENKALIAELSKELRGGWRNALPPK